MRSLFFCFIFSLLLLSGCARIETGEVGLRRTFNGTIEEHELDTGWYQTVIGDVIIFASKEILLTEEGMTPQSMDKSVLKDFDITFTYTANRSEVAYLYTKYSTTAHLQEEKHYEIFPMGAFVTAIIRASAYSAVAQYNALEINNNRAKIEQDIVTIANAKLAHEKLDGKVTVVMVNVKNIQLADIVVESANRAVNAQNDLVTRTTEVKIATQEGLRIKELANQSGPGYIDLLNAQANKIRADALLEAAKNQSTIWVVPQNFTALGGISSIAGTKTPPVE